jgi:hypothetical protein
MKARDFTIALAAAGVAMVLAQDAYPQWPGYHAWPYAAALALVAAVVLGGFRAASPGHAIALLGALIILAAGAGSGLLGPDTETVTSAPGTVAPLPDAGAAAFFPDVAAADIARGDARIIVRRRDGGSFELGPGERRYLAASELSLEPRLAAYIEAHDAGGRHLTITQPTNPAFLSPVVLFAQKVEVAGKLLPADSFATPAVQRQIKAFYFSRDDSEAARMHGMAGVASLLFAVDDDTGHLAPGGIGFVRSGSSAMLGGVRLGGTIGTYPALVVCAVPYGPALFIGGVFIAAGVGLAWAKSDRRHIVRKS